MLFGSNLTFPMISMIIKNKRELFSHGNIEGGKIPLDIIEHIMKSIE